MATDIEDEIDDKAPASLLLRTQNLVIGYRVSRQGPKIVAADLNLKAEAGELICLIGPNGAGKSTLMRTLAGMQPTLAGTVYLAGAAIDRLTAAQRATKLSIVLTEQTNAGLLSAFTVVALGRSPYTDWSGRLSETDERIVEWALHVVGASALAHRIVGELSDGERQKVMIARALAQQTPLILLDEPTAFLDLPRRVEIMALLRRLAHETGRLIILSTHDLDLALRSADQLWILPTGGPLQAGAPEDLILSGAFETAFRAEGLIFDRERGTFRITPDPHGRIVLVGEGLPAMWTMRALEREGWSVTPITHTEQAKYPSTPPLTVTIMAMASADQLGWVLTTDTTSVTFLTVHALIIALRRLRSTP